MVYVVVLHNESHWLCGDVRGRELAAVIPDEKSVVAVGYLASVVNQAYRFPDIAICLQITLMEGIKVAKQSCPAAETTIYDQRPAVK